MYKEPKGKDLFWFLNDKLLSRAILNFYKSKQTSFARAVSANGHSTSCLNLTNLRMKATPTSATQTKQKILQAKLATVLADHGT